MVPQPTLGFSASDNASFRAMLAGAPGALSRLLGGTPIAHANWTGTWPAAERLPFLWRPLTDVQIGGAEFPGCSRISGGGLGGDAALGVDAAFIVADVDVDAGSGAELPSESAPREATLPGRGALGMPALLAALGARQRGRRASRLRAVYGAAARLFVRRGRCLFCCVHR